MTADLVAFLRARLDEDHLTAFAAEGAEWTVENQKKTRDVETFKNPGAVHFGVWVVTGENGADGVAETTDASHARHIARHDPARVLAEVNAKRRVLGVYNSWEFLARTKPHDPNAEITELAVRQTLRALALPYRDHPDYQPEWAPEA